MLFKKKKWIFNLHLIVAIMVVIPLFIVCITGAMLSYDKAIARAINAIITHNADEISKPDFAAVISKFKSQNPSLNISSISYESSNSYYTIYTNQNGKNTGYLISKDGVIISGDNGTSFMRTIRSLHRWLLFNKFDNIAIGKQIVALSAIGFIILVLSGIYIYLPALKHNFIKALSISLKTKKLMIAYKAHTALGVIFAIVFLTMSVTGLFWSYSVVQKAFAWAYGVEIQNRPKGGNKSTPQTIENRFDIIELQTALKAMESNLNSFDTISITQNRAKHYTFNIKNANDQSSITINTDNPNSQIKSNTTQSKSLARKVLDIHSGRVFGFIGEFVFCVVSFMGAVLAVLGFVLTYNRLKPKIHKKPKI